MSATVNEVVEAEGLAEAIELVVVPFGNSYFPAVTGNLSYSRGPGMAGWLQACGMGRPDPPEECFAGELFCQHGPNECVGNIIEACAMHYYPSPAQHWPFIHCYEQSAEAEDATTAGRPSRDDPGAPWRTLRRCAREALVNEEVVRECAEEPSAGLGARLQAEHARATAALVPPHGKHARQSQQSKPS